MLERILATFRKSEYDFRRHACAEDPLRHLFNEWVPYYRLKHAIAAVLEPRSILEIGVRYGYSAISFLSAAPEARYLGLDNDSDRFGGVPGALHWAKGALRPWNAQLLCADTWEMDALPGGPYDLVHVSGRLDGLGTAHDLWLALRCAGWILLDGFLWNELNYSAACRFLIEQKGSIEYYGVIPGYAGELLIKVSERYRKVCAALRDLDRSHRSEALRTAYDREYFTEDCGGWQSFRRSGGRELSDPRQAAVFALASPRAGQLLVDLGCGRGEIAFQAARKGAQALAVDYSPDALTLAKDVFEGHPDLSARVRFECVDVARLALPEPADRVVAADLVEHLHPEELDGMLAHIAAHLAPRGRLVIHTFPNRWYYARGYPAERRAALAAGRYLPKNPRSVYEELMHINEQDPVSLRRTLAAHFRHVRVWVCDDESDFAGSLLRRFNLSDYRKARGIMAVASHDPIDAGELGALLCSLPLPPEERRARCQLLRAPEPLVVGRRHALPVKIENLSSVPMTSRPPHPVHLSYHWKARTPGRSDVFDGLRTGLPFPLLPGESVEVEADVLAPAEPGDYLLEMQLVQEGVAWFPDSAAAAFTVQRV